MRNKRRQLKKTFQGISIGQPKKVVVYWLLLLTVLFAISATVRFVKSVKQTTAYMFSRYAVIVFFPNSGQTILLVKQDDLVNLVEIPSDTKVNVTRGFGLYQLDKIYALGQLNGQGGQLMLESLTSFVDYPVLGLAVSDSAIDLKPGWLSKKQLIDIFSRSSWFYQRKIDKQDLVFRYQFSRREQQVYKLSHYGVMGDVDIDSKIRREDLSLEVINLTKINGLAESIAIKLEKNGFRVVRTDSGVTEKDFVCRVYTRRDLQRKYGYMWLLRFMPCEIGGIQADSERIDVKVEVGPGYQKILEEKW